MRSTTNNVNLAAIVIAAVALVAGLAYLISQPIYAQESRPTIETRLQAAVNSGKITQAAANERLKAFSRMSKDGNEKEGQHRGKPKMTPGDVEARLQAAVEAGKLTQDEADAKLEGLKSGQRMDYENGKQRGRSHSGDVETRIRRGVESGAITQKDADAIRERLSQGRSKQAA